MNRNHRPKPLCRLTRRAQYIALVSVVLLLFLAGAVRVTACFEEISWEADLTDVFPTHSGSSQATAKAVVQFDYASPDATIILDTQNLQNVTSVEVRMAGFNVPRDQSPAVFVVYASPDGKIPAHLEKKITESDLIKQQSPKIQTFADAMEGIANGFAWITVCTKSHPKGELNGAVHMVKTLVYSDDSNSPFHDAALHRQHAMEIASPQSTGSH